ncbi:MAG TPA: PAS domain S-box protein, partial [Smithellaceae bacterium]|nr:PAS domain S-box protein [Smithellaceae bacterium]
MAVVKIFCFDYCYCVKISKNGQRGIISLQKLVVPGVKVMEKAAKTKQELTAEIIVLKKRIRKLEQAGAKLRQAEARREAALELLQQERSLYQDMVNAQPAGIYRIRVFPKEKWKKDAWNVLESAPYSIELASERFCEILGITREIFESTPGIVEEMVHPEDKTEFARKNVEANAKLIPFQWEGRLCVGKKIVWVHFESLPRPVASGDVLWTGFLQDITDHKQAELQKEAAIEALRESEEKLRALSENLAGGMIYQIDSGVDGQKRQFTYLSPAISQLHGLNAEDVLRNPSLLYNQIDENHRAAIAEAEAHAYATKSKLDIDLPIRLSSGEIRWRRFVSYPHTNKSGSVIWDGIELDVTDRKQAEFQREAALQALHDSEERFKSIVTTSQEWIWAMDTERRHTFCNPAVEKILGYRPDEIIGRDIINLLHEEDLPGVREMLNRCLAQKTGWPNLVLRWKHKDGTYRYLESNAVPILDSMGNISGFQGSDRDITGRRQAEEALKKSAEKLRKEMRFNNLLFDNSPAFI